MPRTVKLEDCQDSAIPTIDEAQAEQDARDSDRNAMLYLIETRYGGSVDACIAHIGELCGGTQKREGGKDTQVSQRSLAGSAGDECPEEKGDPISKDMPDSSPSSRKKKRKAASARKKAKKEKDASGYRSTGKIRKSKRRECEDYYEEGESSKAGTLHAYFLPLSAGETADSAIVVDSDD